MYRRRILNCSVQRAVYQYLHSCSKTHAHKTHNIQYSKEYKIQKLIYILILMPANPLLGPLEGEGPENLDFFGPKWPSIRSLPFQSPKKSQESGPTPAMTLITVIRIAILKPSCGVEFSDHVKHQHFLERKGQSSC